jgi:nucleoid-associated protein YgaU
MKYKTGGSFMRLLLLLALISLVSCSGKKTAKDLDSDTSGIVLADTDEFTEETSSDVIAQGTEALMYGDGDTMGQNEPTSSAPVIQDVGGLAQYTVQKNDTLMLIAFKLYGDYDRWREIARENSQALQNGNQIKEGTVLNYTRPMQEFVWSPEGNPYLIKKGDTLGHISSDVYGTSRKWQSIWDNNKPLIKDPNKIFVGFTIYYLNENREVASEPTFE